MGLGDTWGHLGWDLGWEGLGNQLHGIQTFRLLGDTWGGFRGHLGTLGVGLGNTWRHLGWDMECVWSNLQDVPGTLLHLLQVT